MPTIPILSAVALLLNVALFVNASRQASGRPIVQNSCNYAVYLDIVQGTSSIRHVLKAGKIFDRHHWTSVDTDLEEPSTDAGWALKLRKSSASRKPLQLEYTWLGPGTPSLTDEGVEFRFGCQNGDPFNGNWLANSSQPLMNGALQPESKCEAFRAQLRTKDLGSKQERCSADTDIKLTLCPNRPGGDN